MGFQRKAASWDPPWAARVEPLHESERTRVTRLVSEVGSVIRKEPLGPSARRRLRHEVEILERLSGAEEVAQLAAGAAPSPGSILLADVGGTALSESVMPLDRAGLGGPLARAVAGMHRRGVMHRDINPANIVVSDRGAPCLIDFALATRFTVVQPGFVHHTEAVGTLLYLAPDRTRRRHVADVLTSLPSSRASVTGGR
jgi:serine/threonine protein kinase